MRNIFDEETNALVPRIRRGGGVVITSSPTLYALACSHHLLVSLPMTLSPSNESLSTFPRLAKCDNSSPQVGGKIAVSKTVSNIKDFRGSDLFVGSHFSSGSTIGQGKIKYPTGVSQAVSRQLKGHGGLTGSAVTMVSSASQRNKTDKDEGGEGIRRVSGSASISDTGPTFTIVPALAQEKGSSWGGGGGFKTSMVADDTAPAEEEEPKRSRRANAGPLQQGDGFFKGVDKALNKGKGTKGGASSDGKRQENTEKNNKPAANIIGDVLGKLPLSKLKIVIGAWV